MKQEHYDILKEGIESWNLWRNENPQVRPDLSWSELSLTQPAFRSIKEQFVPKNYSGINFSKTNLTGCILKGANLSFSNLSYANFQMANLRRANLSFAILHGANFDEANLTLANLVGADLTNAKFWETVLARTNFDNANGLEKIIHPGPSIIDHRTFLKSPNLPVPFLKGIGMPLDIIDGYQKFIRNRKTKSCFISHSSKDSEFVEKLYYNLQEKKVRCWYAPKDLGYGAKFRGEIGKLIKNSDKFIVVLSSNSINSYWVEDEIEAAIESEIENKVEKIIPIMIDVDVLKEKKEWFRKIKRSLNIADFSDWKNPLSYRKNLKKLKEAINRKSSCG